MTRHYGAPRRHNRRAVVASPYYDPATGEASREAVRCRMSDVRLMHLTRETWMRHHDGEEPTEATVYRMSVNWLRHMYTDYDARVRGLWRGTPEQAAIAREVLEDIALAYPRFAPEARRQAALYEDAAACGA